MMRGALRDRDRTAPSTGSSVGSPTGVVYAPHLSEEDRRLLLWSSFRAELRRARTADGAGRPNGSAWWRRFALSSSVAVVVLAALYGAFRLLHVSEAGEAATVMFLVALGGTGAACRIGYRGARDRARTADRLKDAFVDPDDLRPGDRQLLVSAQRAIRTVIESRARDQGVIDATASQMVLAEEEWRLAQHLTALSRIRTAVGDLGPGRAADALGQELPDRAPTFHEIERTLNRRVRALQDYAAAVTALDERLHHAQLPQARPTSRAEQIAESLDDLTASLSADQLIDLISDLTGEADLARCALAETAPPPPGGQNVPGCGPPWPTADLRPSA